MKNTLRLFIFCSVLVVFSGHSVRAAFDPKDYEDLGIYFVGTDCNSLNTESPTATPTTPSLGPVFMVGDSITLGAKESYKLEDRLKKQGMDAFIVASGGASIKGAGTTGEKKSGIGMVESNRDKVKDAGKIIIALGTNDVPANFKENAEDLLRLIKKYNPNAPIYWVNVKTDKPGSPAYTKDGAKKKNSIVAGLSSTNDFEVIDIYSSDVPLAENDGVHPDYSNAGFGRWGDIIAKTVGGESSSQPDNQPNSGQPCECSADQQNGVSSLVGSSRAEKVWNYFLNKSLEPYQIAGILGNLSVESNFNPRIVEGGSEANAPVAGKGYGLAQWTDSGRQGLLIKRAEETNKKIYTLEFQVEHIWWELNHNEKSAFENFKKTKNVSDATYVFSKQYERPAWAENPERPERAKEYLTEYGSSSAGSTPAGSSDSVSCQTNQDSREVTGEYSLPVDKKWYRSNPEWFKLPHHRDPNDPGIDIPVVRGVPIYSITAGKVILAPNEGGYGKGVSILAPDGVQYDYGHGYDGGSIKGAKQGDTVKAGQLIMHTNDTGSSQGDHLHLSILVKGKEVCPHRFLISVAKGNPIDPKKEPSSGCTTNL